MWKTKIQKPWYKSDSAYLYASYINYNKNQCAGKHTQATQFSCSFAVLWGLCLVILNKILRFTIFHVKLQKMSEMLDIYNNNSTCVLANMYIIVNIIAMLCIFYADDNNKEPADKCKLMNLMTNSLFPGFGILQ